MANRQDAKGRSKREARHLRLYGWLTDTVAWQSLDCVARCVYCQVATRYTGSNNGAIGCSVRDIAKELHVGKSTAMAALGTLVERGFIVREQRGHLARERVASLWRLTEHRCDLTGALPTKEFTRWRPEI